jgi:hypothetical protein
MEEKEEVYASNEKQVIESHAVEMRFMIANIAHDMKTVTV